MLGRRCHRRLDTFYLLFESTNLHPPLSLLLGAPIIKQEKKEKCVLFVCNLFSALFRTAPIEKIDVRLEQQCLLLLLGQLREESEFG